MTVVEKLRWNQVRLVGEALANSHAVPKNMIFEVLWTCENVVEKYHGFLFFNPRILVYVPAEERLLYEFARCLIVWAVR